ncbi:avr2 family secreted RxLR effector peptide protein, putative [Phytophthora infestans T30-4]
MHLAYIFAVMAVGTLHHSIDGLLVVIGKGNSTENGALSDPFTLIHTDVQRSLRRAENDRGDIEEEQIVSWPEVLKKVTAARSAKMKVRKVTEKFEDPVSKKLVEHLRVYRDKGS